MDLLREKIVDLAHRRNDLPDDGDPESVPDKLAAFLGHLIDTENWMEEMLSVFADDLAARFAELHGQGNNGPGLAPR
jgi:hypothetical protein